jgi:hypothetical protein
MRSVATERDEVRPRLGNAQRLAPEHPAGYAVVPCTAHEAEAIRWVGHDGVDAGGLHAAHHVEAVAVSDRNEVVREERTIHEWPCGTFGRGAGR